MKKLLLFLIVLNLFQQVACAQDKTGQALIDSLQTKLLTAKEDTNKVIFLYELAFARSWSNPDTALVIDKQAMMLAEKLNWKKGIARIVSDLGDIELQKGNIAKALEHNRNALKLFEQLISSSDKALMFYAKTQKGHVLCNTGNSYLSQGKINIAVDYYLKAVKIAEEVGDEEYEAGLMCNIGICYENSDKKKELEYYLKGINILDKIPLNKQIQTKQFKAIITGNIGNVYESQKNYIKALEYYKKALQVGEQLGDISLQSAGLRNIGNIYLLEKNYTLALQYANESLKMRENLKDNAHIPEVLNMIGQIQTASGNFEQAEKNYTKSLIISSEGGMLNEIANSEEQLSRLYDTTGRSALALVHYKKFIVARDSMNTQETNKKLLQNEMNEAFEKKEAETKAKQEKKDLIAASEMRRQKLLRNGFVGGFAILLLFSVIVFKQRNKIKIEKKQSDKLLLNILP